MNARQAKFAAEYLVDLSATQAAIRAGYSKKTAGQTGFDLLRKPEIAAAIEDGKAKRSKRVEVTADRVLEELAAVAFLDQREFFDDDGNLKPIKEWTKAMGVAVGGFEVIIKNAVAGDGKMDRIHKYRMWDKVKALELLAKHVGVAKERIVIERRVDVSKLTDEELQARAEELHERSEALLRKVGAR